MADASRYLDEVGRLVRAMEDLGIDAVLVGGMALVTIGSRRVTRDFDFVIAHPGERLPALVDLFYDRGLELASRVDENGEVTAVIGTPRVAASRLRLDAPSSAYFLDSRTGLRVDLLFDFPLPAAGLAERARRLTIRGRTFRIASESDLLQLKKIAAASRAAPGDSEDIAFLEARRDRDR